MVGTHGYSRMRQCSCCVEPSTQPWRLDMHRRRCRISRGDCQRSLWARCWLANHRYDNSSAHLRSSSGCRSVVLRWPFVTVLAYVCRRHSSDGVRLHCISVHTVCITSSSTGSRSHCKNCTYRLYYYTSISTGSRSHCKNWPVY